MLILKLNLLKDSLSGSLETSEGVIRSELLMRGIRKKDTITPNLAKLQSIPDQF